MAEFDMWDRGMETRRGSLDAERESRGKDKEHRNGKIGSGC